MKWAVGTGQCGMHNWTLWVGGYIESEVKLRKLAVDYYQDPSIDLSYAYEKFRERAAMKVPGVADCCQFMFIDVISKVDPKAEFVWLIRDKKETVDSLFEKSSEEERIHPKGWDFAYKNKRTLLDWYYDEVNKIIEEKLNGKKFSILKTTDMPRMKK